MAITRPSLMQIPFCATGSRNIIPIDPPGESDVNQASYDVGFPPATMTPIAAGGKPPKGRDMNGILFETTSHTVFQNAGGQYRFDATLATAIGGYSVGDVLQSNDGKSSYVSLVNNNTTDFNSNPESIGTEWAAWAGESIKPASGAPVGSGLIHYGSTAPQHYLVCDGSAISRVAYPELFTAIGTIYGEGDGSTTFNLPNMLDRFAQGKNTGFQGIYIDPGLPNTTGSIYGAADISAADGVFSTFVPPAHARISAGTVVSPGVGASFDPSRSNPIYGASNTVQPAALTILPCIKYE